MKTPITEAQIEIAKLWSSPSDQPTYTQIFEILDRLLPKEKEVIENAYYWGGCDFSEHSTKLSRRSKTYFNETFTQK